MWSITRGIIKVKDKLDESEHAAKIEDKIERIWKIIQESTLDRDKTLVVSGALTKFQEYMEAKLNEVTLHKNDLESSLSKIRSKKD